MPPSTKELKLASIAFNLYVFFFIIYFLTNTGFAPTYIDVGQLRLDVAESIIERFDLAVPTGHGIQGADGREYSWFSIGSVLLSLPFYLAAKLFGAAPVKFVSIINQLISAATVVLVFLFCRKLSFSNKTSLLTSIFYGLGTMAWKYSKEPGDHALEAFFVLLSVYFVCVFSNDKKFSSLFWSALSLGFAILIRSTSVLVLPSLFLIATFDTLKTKGLKSASWHFLKISKPFAITLLPFLVICSWYNHARFGSVFESGYSLMAMRLGVDYFAGTSITNGLHGLLASPGKGLFIYSPITILFFISIRSFFRKHPGPALAFISVMLMYILLYSKYKFWHGDFAWGPRFIFVTLPFFIIPMTTLLDSFISKPRMFPKLAVTLIFLFSFTIQLSSVAVFSYNYLIHLQTTEGVKLEKFAGMGSQPIVVPPASVYFDWHESPIIANLTFIKNMAGALPAYRYVDLPDDVSIFERLNLDPGMNLFDFWWVHKYYIDRNYIWLFLPAVLFVISIIYAVKVSKAITDPGVKG